MGMRTGCEWGKTYGRKEFFVAVVVAVAGKVEKGGKTAWRLGEITVRVFQNRAVELRRKGKESRKGVCCPWLSAFSSAGVGWAVKMQGANEERACAGKPGGGLEQEGFARRRRSPRFAQGSGEAWKIRQWRGVLRRQRREGCSSRRARAGERAGAWDTRGWWAGIASSASRIARAAGASRDAQASRQDGRGRCRW